MAVDRAPVALFAYRRPEHLRRTLASLAACPEAPDTALVAFCDGAKGPDDTDDVAAVRRLLHEVGGFGSVSVVERDRNVGLAANVIDGVTSVLRDSPTVIVLEDDMVVSPDFLAYMNAGLALYAGDEQVVSIHGYVYPTRDALPDTFFLRGADCWGWATWRRGWAVFDPDGAALLARVEAAGLQRDFDLDGAFPYTAMLRDQVEGRTDSWAVRWYASAFLADKLTLYPGRSLVLNIGLDGTGTNSLPDDSLGDSVARMPHLVPVPVEESQAARAAIAGSLSRRRPVLERVRRWVSR